MHARILLLLLLAAGAGVGTIQFTRQWLASQQAMMVETQPIAVVTPVQPPPPPPITHVLVAAADLTTGRFIAAEDLRWQAWPDEALAPAYVVEGTQSAEDFVGAVVRSRLTAGEPVTEGRLVRPGDRGFLAAVLTPGMRAVAVPVTETTGVAGLIFPGDRVDIILSLGVPDDEPSSNAMRRAGETVLTDIRVLAIDQRLEDEPGQPQLGHTVTLEVTPRQAETIAVMLELGSIALSLRSLAEPDPVPPMAAQTPPAPAGPEGEVPAASSPDGAAPRRIYTLDTDVARALRRRPAATPQPQTPPPPEVAVVRGNSTRGGAAAQPPAAGAGGGSPLGGPAGGATANMASRLMGIMSGRN